MSRFDVVVVGAGVTGLTVAYRLARQGRRVCVLEAAARPGGVIGSLRRDGVLYELGPNSAMDTSPIIGRVLDDLGIADQRIAAEAAAARRYVIQRGAPVELPVSAGAFWATPLFSWRAKLALLREPFRPARAADAPEESVAEFVCRRLGREWLDYAIEPFVAGIYAGDPQRLSMAAAFPRLVELERSYGSLIRGALLGARARRRQQRATGETSRSVAGSFSFRAGMQTFTDALAGAVGDVRCGVTVEAVRPAADGGYRVEALAGGQPMALATRAVVIATPAPAAARLLAAAAAAAPPLAGAAAALTQIDYPPVATVASAYRRSDVRHALDGFGVLAPSAERPPVLGTLFSTSMFAGRAPTDVVLLTTFVGGRRDPQAALAPAETVAATAQAAIARYLGGGQPLWQEVTCWPQAIPQYDFGHRARVAAVAAAETAQPGLFFAASWRDGVAVGDCVKNGYLLAERIAGWFVGVPAPPRPAAASAAASAASAAGAAVPAPV